MPDTQPRGDPESPNTEAGIIREAQDRFKRCEEYYGEANRRWLEDWKFANGDSENWYQWPEKIRQGRQLDDSPCLTINKTRQHNLQIINDARQNKPGIKYRPVGGGATYQAGQALMGLARHIEYQSNAQAIYDFATNHQVQAGVGYWRLTTDYVDDSSFDQEVYIRPVMDPLGVFLDPDCKELDKSDAAFGFIFDDIPKDKFEREYPQYKDIGGQAVLGNSGTDWITRDKVRHCEYFRKVMIRDTLIEYVDQGTGQPTGILASMLPKELRDSLKAEKHRTRTTYRTTIEWKYIVGERVVDEKVWPGTIIPIVEIVGEETIIEGKLDRKGHTRALKDPQRIYNYWSSSAVEYGALQTKTPWKAPAQAVEGYSDIWANANRKNVAFLPYNQYDESGQKLDPPQRTEPPVAAPVAITGMQVAAQELMMASGQYQSEMGEQGNERSAKAINERQRQGDTATYHYIDNLAQGIRKTGKIILELVPLIYDTNRILMIIAEDGATVEVEIDPRAKQAFLLEQMKDESATKRILNPNVGKYEVQADIGPAYATKRMEAFDAFTLILTQAPQVASVVGDLLMKAADFPMADEAAARLKRMVPPQALGTGPSQMEQELGTQVEQLKGVVTELMNELAKAQLQLKNKEQEAATGSYKAITERAKVAWDGAMDVAQLEELVQRLVREKMTQRQEEGQSQGTQPRANGPAIPVLNPPSPPTSPANLATQLQLKFQQ